jgi:C4-dicarboxylate transporter
VSWDPTYEVVEGVATIAYLHGSEMDLSVIPLEISHKTASAVGAQAANMSGKARYAALLRKIRNKMTIKTSAPIPMYIVVSLNEKNRVILDSD